MSKPHALERIDVPHAGGQYPVYLGHGLMGQPHAWHEHITGHVLVVTEDTVAGHYLDALQSSLGESRSVEAISFAPGEGTKNMDAFAQILDRLVAMGAQRDATIIALGGGVIGDLAGFAAASYMRGIGIIGLPTTLLAQVDAAIGGKTAINHPRGKNLIGAFHQPKAVVVDLNTLHTLSDRHYRAGLAEVVKYGAIRDLEFFEWLEAHTAELNAREPDVVHMAVQRSVENKKQVVVSDEREQGQRALLNFGHTFGHALETLTDYGLLEHGEAVAIGMVLAARLSEQLEMIPHGVAERIEALLHAFHLPTQRPDHIGAKNMLEAMRLDKKNKAQTIHLILLEDLGQAVVRPCSEEELLGFLKG